MKRLSFISLLFLCSFMPQINNQQSELDDVLSKMKKVNNAFTFGEKLTYRVHYGPLDGGKAYFSIQNTPEMVNNRSTYYVKVNGKSAGLVDMMFKVKDEFESYIDQEALVPLKATKRIKEGKYTDSDFIVFDHAAKIASGKRGKTEILSNTQDIISAIYYARSMDMTSAKPGDVFPVPFYLDGKTYELRFKFEKREVLKTDIGTFKTIKVKPQLIEGRVFKDNEALTLWVTDDENKIPVRVESDIFVGSVKVDLAEMSGIRNPLTSKIK
ncbi:MAG: DUF3108 domain-containing protein [Candidatus Methylacidiphilales bacterium]